MEFSIRYIRDGIIYENIWNIGAHHTSSSSKIMSAAKAALDNEFGTNSPKHQHYTLLRVKSYTKPEAPAFIPKPRKSKSRS